MKQRRQWYRNSAVLGLSDLTGLVTRPLVASCTKLNTSFPACQVVEMSGIEPES